MWIIIRPGNIPEPSGSFQVADCNVGFAHNLLFAVKGKPVGISGEVDLDGIGHQSHAYVGCDDLIIDVVLFVGLVLLHR